MCAGIAHNDVNAAEHPGDIPHKQGDVACVANVGDKPFRFCWAKRGNGSVKFDLVASANRDSAALGCEFLRNGEADTAGAAGDQGNLAAQAEIHRFLPEHIALVTAVDADRAAGDESSAIGGQKSYQVGNFVGPAGAAQGI